MANYSNQPPRRDERSREQQTTTENWEYGEVKYNEKWISERIDGDAVKFAEGFAEKVLVNKEEKNGKEGISTSQFRNIYGEIKRIQLKGFDKEKPAFHLLRPKIAYAVKRQETKGSKKFKELVEKLHIAVDADGDGAENRYENFCDFIEALLAFHKAKGGKS